MIDGCEFEASASSGSQANWYTRIFVRPNDLRMSVYSPPLGGPGLGPARSFQLSREQMR